MKRRGFTIIELLAVIAILAVLMTIVVSAATGVLRNSRTQRTAAMRVALQAAITAYHAADANGEWPGEIENCANEGESKELGDEESQKIFQKIVQCSTGEGGGKKLPLVDPSALFVAPSGATDGKTSGLPFNEARQGTARRQKLSVANMHFGYQETSSGKFHRFKIYYNAPTDSVEVR